MRKLRRGEWYDSDTIMFEAMFEILRRYVEQEIAWMEVVWASRYSWWIRFRVRWFPFEWRKELTRELILRYWEWETALEDAPDQANCASNVRDLYLWYVDEYPKLTDPYSLVDDSNELHYIDKGGNMTDKMLGESDPITGDSLMNRFTPKYKRHLLKCRNLENKQNKMIDSKLRSLLKIRRGLWT